ncbi:MAG: hypothetical protein MJ137_06390 [Clostridia bacterium]|nr:hypothetical protein [Clostridia bacterium]
MKKNHFYGIIRTTSLIALLAVFISLLQAFPSAADSQITTATFSSPALGTDIGQALNLTSCAVQFESGKQPIKGSDIKWTVGGKEVTSFTPSEKGITEASAEYGTLKAKIYIVAKAPSDEDYVLYSNDFSADPSAEFRTVQKTSGTKIEHDAAAGTYKLNASNDGSAYIRVLLPSWLDSFGDAIIDTSFFLSNPNGASSRWGAVMFRVQKNDFPYMINTFRHDSSLSNGVELGKRTESDQWNIMKTGSASLSNTAFNKVRIHVSGTDVTSTVGGKQVLAINSADYHSGSFGLQVRGVSMTLDYIRICLNPASSPDIQTVPGGYADIVPPESNISLSPVVVGTAGTEADAAKAVNDGASAVSFELRSENDSPVVILGSKKITPSEAIALLEGKAIPVFSTDDIMTAKLLSQELRKNNLRDAMLISSDLTVIDTAKSQWNYINTVYRASEEPISAIKDKATANGARIVILPENMMTRENINFLQDRYMEVWADKITSETEAVAAINLGVCGLITSDTAACVASLTKYYSPNTLTRYPNITGHRGIPSKAQENSLEGSILAAEYGATCIENDIYLVKDGVLMVMHDSTIDRTTTGTGKITSMTSAELAKYKINTYAASAPVSIPSLEDYLKQFKDSGVTLVIEIKENNTSMAAPLAKLLREYDMTNQAVIISFHEAPLKALRQQLAGISEAYLNSSIAPSEENHIKTMSEIMAVIQPLRTVYSPSYAAGELGEKLVGDLVARGVTTWIWTVNNIVDFNNYFISGTRGITTNYVDWASKYIKNLDVEYDEATGSVKVTATSYSGEVTDVTSDVEMVAVDGAKEALAFSDGKVSGEGAFFFRLDCRTSNGKHYSKVTELLSNVKPEPEVTTAESTDTAVPGETTDASAAKKGCGSSVSVIAVLAAFLASPAIIRKKHND